MYSSIPIVLVVFLVAIAVVNGFADAYHWYWTMRWFDAPMHFAGGMWLAGTAIWWHHSRRGIPPQGFAHTLSVCLISAFGVGLLWEVYEAVVSIITVGHMNALPDTLGDLLFDILGGTTVAILIWARAKLKNT